MGISNRFAATSPIGPPADGRVESRRLLSAILVGYIAFVIYGSLVPLHFVARPLYEAITEFSQVRLLQLGIESRADWVANYLLFIPLGFVGGARFALEGSLVRRGLALLFLAAAGIAFAVAIEFTQVFFPERTVSQNDILAEGLGGICGLLGSIAWGGRVRAWLQVFWQAESRRGRVRRLLHLYLFALLAFSLLPLDLTLSPADLFHKWRQGRVVLVPFSSAHGGLFETSYGYLSEILIWLPVGWLWLERGRNRLLTVILWGSSAALAIECAQLFVFTRVTDTTDALLAALGVGLGAVLGTCSSRFAEQVSTVSARTWWGLWWVWVVAILGGFWYPFAFTVDRISAEGLWAVLIRIPFLSYYQTSEFHALNELLRKISLFFPGGALLGLAMWAGKRVIRPWRGLIVPALVATVVEGGQLLLPGKIADTTDWLIECAGAWLGLLTVRWLASVPWMPVTNVPANPRHSASREPGIRGGAAPRRREWLSDRWSHIVWIGLLGVMVGVFSKLPGVPYNVRELVPGGAAGVLSCLALALVVYLSANLPFFRFGRTPGRFVWDLPVLLIGQGILVWALLRMAVPLESMHDVVGSPVLPWPWELEVLGRFLALYAAIMIQMVGGAWAVGVILVPTSLPRFLSWVIFCLLLSWPLHTAVVTFAATDNLVELMRDGGSFTTSSVLASGMFLLSVGASAASALLAGCRRSGWLVFMAISAPGLAAIAFWFSQESVIVKYGRVFSAAQFLLSPDRAHYVDGPALVVRYVVALVVVVVALAVMQWPSWRRLARA